ncbi:ECF transporter S component [Sedimentibacter sp. zth1]|uniref:ECF transporter S component n=1 Tax=Sedimentibacter sp. zth1 TaxID=2816908 RepID=UPI001A9208FE|nr:ECF transporter S component [Sedimentibacter sp. zth1]QSX06753.1 ECF transporter S component [Sedimentibacter sp. zth1]
MNKKRFTTRRLAVIGLMSAMVFIATNFRIDIPTPLGKTMLHLGNVMCLLSGLLFGGLTGGLASGFGSAMFDLFDPQYVSTAWITFIMKFAMGFIAGSIAHRNNKNGENKKYNIIAAIVGAISYVILYISKTIVMSYFLVSTKPEGIIAATITKATASTVNAIMAVIFSLILTFALRPALKKAGLFKKLS